jgi:NADH:ubiquinone oxidoreductase subunit C
MTQPALEPAGVAEALGDLGAVERVRSNRVRLTTAPERVREAIVRAKERLRCDHVVHIAAVDNGKTLELHYHLTGGHRTLVTIRTELPRTDPAIPSAHDLLPPAGIYERQVHDLFGIRFEGHPDLRRLILNEDWPADEFPLRKDWKMDPNKSYGGPPPEVT